MKEETIAGFSILHTIVVFLLFIMSVIKMECGYLRHVKDSQPIGRYIELNDTIFVLTPFKIESKEKINE